jgi:3-oxoacyl-[acyl-carrier-protein] synthase III
MAITTIPNIDIKAIAACVPKNKESNYEYSLLSESEQKLLVKTTGIENRRVASETLCTSDMCFESAEKIINELKINREEIDIVILVSQTIDYFLPATSIILQDRLKLSKNTVAFDVVLGCSGYVYGLSIISSMMSNGNFKKGLLLVGDKSTFSLSKEDKSTYPLFGDAGTATYLEYNENSDPITFNLQSDGSGYKSIIVPDGATRSPWTIDSDKMIELEKGVKRSKRNLWLDGIEVFNFSLREAAPNVKTLLENINTSTEDYDYFVFHQANKLMNESIRKKLKLPVEKVPYSLKDFGNTSSASIPLTIVTELENKLNKPTNIVLSAFGVGLSWGSAAIRNADIKCFPLIEIE